MACICEGLDLGIRHNIRVLRDKDSSNIVESAAIFMKIVAVAANAGAARDRWISMINAAA